MSTVRCEPAAIFELSAPGEGKLMLPIKRKELFPSDDFVAKPFQTVSRLLQQFLVFPDMFQRSFEIIFCTITRLAKHS